MENQSVIINKSVIIENCLKRINEEYDSNVNNLGDYTRQDSIVLNLQRACEACVDMAMYIVSTRKLGIPQVKREAFELLYKNNLIDKEMYLNMKNMVGFRNIAIHDYKNIDDEVLIDILDNHLSDLKEFSIKMLNLK